LNATSEKPAHPWAVEAAREFGIRLENHRARILSLEMVEQADAILVMDFQNYVEIVSKYPNSKKKAFFLGAYANEREGIEIRDPYYLGPEATSRCFHLLNSCISALVESMRSNLGSAATTPKGSAATRGSPAHPARETTGSGTLHIT